MCQDHFTLYQASVELGVNEGDVYRLTEAGKLPSEVIGGLIMVRKEDVYSMVDSEE